MELTEGPKKVIIPEQRYWSCYLCRYYEHRMVRSGYNPEYESVCKKLDLLGNESDEKTFIFYNLNSEKTPQQCPFLKSEERNDKLDNLGID